MKWLGCLILGAGAVVALGCGVEPSPGRTMGSARDALTGSAETLELATPAERVALFRDVASSSLLESGRAATSTVLFPLVRDQGEVTAAPGVDPRTDLLVSADAGVPLTFEGPGDRWPEDRRDSLQGLSEREVAELVARTLIAKWSLGPSGPVEVDRAAGAPYAVAYANGILRINPSFLYLAAAASGAPPTAVANQ